MTTVFIRIAEKKLETKKTWDEVTKEAHIPLKSWMTGLPGSSPTDAELKKLAPVLNTTFKWLKYGKK
jgi:hypothetical protein